MTEPTTPKKPRTVSPELAASRLAKRLSKEPITTLRIVALLSGREPPDLDAEEAKIGMERAEERRRFADRMSALNDRSVAVVHARLIFGLPEPQRTLVRATVVAAVRSAARRPKAPEEPKP